MRSTTGFISIAILSLSLAVAAFAEPWTVQQCIGEAIKRSWTIQESQLALERAEISLQEAKSKRGLSLSGTASHTLSDTPLAQDDPAGVENGSNVGLSASLPLYSGGSLSANISRNTLLKEAQRSDHQLRERMVALNVVQIALAHLQWRDEITWREMTIEACDSSLARTRALFSLGVVLESDTLLAAGNCATERVARTTARNGSDRTLRELLKWIGLPSSFPLKLVFPDSTLLSAEPFPDLELLLEEALLQSPQLRIDSLSRIAIQESEQIARASGRPQINLTASASTGIKWTPADYGDELKNKYQHGVTLGISIPILNRGTTTAALERALIERKEIAIESERNLRQLQEQIEDLWIDRNSMIEQLPAAELAMSAAEQNYLHDRERHTLGAISYADLLTSQSNRDSARYRWQKTRWSLAENRLTLDIQLGKELR